MTLADFIHLGRDLTAAIARLRDAIVTAESADELELLASRLSKACDTVSKAKCADAGRHEVIEAMNLVEKGRRLAFTVGMASKGEAFPRLHVGSA
jgi:hypothetical protein